MTLLAFLKILLVGMVIFVVVLVALYAVAFAFGLLGLAIVGPPALVLLSLSKILELLQRGLLWLFGLSAKDDSREEAQGSDFSASHKSTKTASCKESPAEDAHHFDPYIVLGIAHGASKREITEAYRQKMLKNHPDRVSHMDKAFQELANERAINVQRAYDALQTTS